MKVSVADCEDNFDELSVEVKTMNLVTNRKTPERPKLFSLIQFNESPNLGLLAANFIDP
jgi:hypothetical protein